MGSIRARSLVLPAVAVVGLVVLGILGADTYRPSPRVMQLEMEIEGLQDELDAARDELAEVETMLAEAEATLEVEQQHREQAEQALADCLEGPGD
jgi:septal ring factor EnvC (AmiA/AmiB activator)